MNKWNKEFFLDWDVDWEWDFFFGVFYKDDGYLFLRIFGLGLDKEGIEVFKKRIFESFGFKFCFFCEYFVLGYVFFWSFIGRMG